MNFSRRKAMQPLPPAPLAAYTFATSRKRIFPGLSGGLFSQEIGPRQQHVMAQDRHASGPAFPHGRAIVARPQLGQDMTRGGIVVEPAGMELILVKHREGVSRQPV